MRLRTGNATAALFIVFFMKIFMPNTKGEEKLRYYHRMFLLLKIIFSKNKNYNNNNACR